MSAPRTYTVELSAETADYLEDQVQRGEARSIGAAIDAELGFGLPGNPLAGVGSEECEAFLKGALATYNELRAGTTTASPLAEVRARFRKRWEDAGLDVS